MKKISFAYVLIGFFCINFVLTLWLSNLAYTSVIPGISLESPKKVAKGDAFLVTFKSEHKANYIEFSWKNKEYTIPTELIDGIYTATFLLPVAINSKNDSSILTVKPMLTQDQSADNLPVFTRDIVFYEKNRPVEKLKVDPKYVVPPKNKLERIAKDRKKSKEAMAIFQPEKNWTLPLYKSVPGSISSVYGVKRVYNGVPKNYHMALDLRGAMGTPIRAVADGKVLLADSLYYSGNVIYLDHGYGVMSTYSHMSKFNSELGQDVKKGDVIGYIGSTGQSTGPHLHLGLIVLGTAVDPLPFLEVKKKKSK